MNEKRNSLELIASDEKDIDAIAHILFPGKYAAGDIWLTLSEKIKVFRAENIFKKTDRRPGLC